MDDLEKILLKIKEEYSFIEYNSNELNYLIKKFNRESDLDIFEKKVREYCIKKTKIMLDENKDLVINNYINYLLKNNNNTLLFLRKLGSFFNIYKLNLSPDFLVNLIKHNDNLCNVIDSYIKNNSNNMINNQYLNENIISMIEIYCSLNNIEFNDNNDINITNNINNPIESYFKEIKKYPVLTFSEERELFNKINSGDQEAKEYFIKCNLRLVASIANRYYKSDIDIFDLIQEGNIGLIEAVNRFDSSKGYKFSTYAVWWIKNYISKSIYKVGRSENFSLRTYQKLRIYKKTKSELEKKLNRIVDYVEVAHEMKISESDALKLENIINEPVSLNSKILDDDMEIIDTLSSKEESVEKKVINKVFLEEIINYIDNLKINERDKEIFKERYGLIDGNPKNLEEVGKKFNITSERVRQIESHILRKIKKSNITNESLIKNKIVVKNNNNKIEDYVFMHLRRFGSKDQMIKVMEYLNKDELKILYTVFGRLNLNDGSVSNEVELYFYNAIFPKIKKYSQYVINKNINSYVKDSYNFSKLDDDVRNLLKLLKQQIPLDFYKSLNYGEKVILASFLNKNNALSRNKMIEYLKIDELEYNEFESKVMNLYKEYIYMINDRFIPKNK